MARWGPLTARIREWIPTSFWAAALVQTIFLVALAASDGYDVARTGEATRVVLTYVTVLALFTAVHLAAPSRAWSRRATAVVFVLFVAVNFARFETAGSFDYGFAHENVREVLTPLGRNIVLANVRPWEVGGLLLVPLGGLGALVRWPPRPWPAGRRSRAVAVLGCVAVLVGLPLARVTTHESLTGFLASALRFHAESRAAAATSKGEPYPFVREAVPSVRARAVAGEDKPRPHVILLLMESWSATYSDKARADGSKITPVFDARRREGLTYDHFYGNSVQSSRGHFATLCSIIPMVRRKEFIDIPDTRLRCLPEVLREAGYRTLFLSATADPDFDSADTFLARIGFSDVRWSVEAPGAPPDPARWGMGIQDDELYRRFFGVLDDKIAREPGAPVFAVVANASHHYPFDKNPKHVPEPGYPTKYRRNFVASLAAADAWLATFWGELERRPALRDAIVIAVGDHSFPADEHGIHFNGLGSYEEAFHTGFALRWSGHVEPQVVTDRAASQIDIAPTILDLLQIRTKTPFTGTSLFADGAPTPVPLVQPYDGVHLAAVQWPLKLVRHESADQEHLYDLAADPDEEHDRIGDPRLGRQLADLRRALVGIRASEAVVRANRVWPPP